MRWKGGKRDAGGGGRGTHQGWRRRRVRRTYRAGAPRSRVRVRVTSCGEEAERGGSTLGQAAAHGTISARGPRGR